MGNQILKDARGRVLGMIETKPSVYNTRVMLRGVTLGVMIPTQTLQEMNVVADRNRKFIGDASPVRLK